LSFPVIVRKPEQELSSLARALIRDGYTTVVAAGGDGTVSGIASGVIGTDASLGILPLGTLNHLAKDLGIPLDLPSAIQTLVAGQRALIDVAEVNGHFFLNNSSIGLYPLFVEDRERQQRELKRPKWRAAVAAAAAALRIFPMLHMHIVPDGPPLERRTPFLFVGNNQYEFQGLRAGGRRCIDEGRLCLLVTHDTQRLRLLWLGLKALVFGMDRATDFDALTASAIDVRMRRRIIPVALDGEVKRLQPPLRYRIRPQALRVAVPYADRTSATRDSIHANAAASV
jgi:diacylglycerol kinase family enzyme